MSQAALRTRAAGPVGHAQRAERLRPGLEEAAPEALDPCVGLRRTRVDRDGAPARVGRGPRNHQPEVVGHCGAPDAFHVRAFAKLGTAARRTVDALGHKGEAWDVQGQAVHFHGGGGPVEAEGAALQLWRLRAAFPERRDGS